MFLRLGFAFIFIFFSLLSFSQTDSLQSNGKAKVVNLDSLPTVKILNKRSPYRATLYAALLPGTGQLYNKQYWKAPLVYAGAGIFAYFISSNNSQYLLYNDLLTELNRNPGVVPLTFPARFQGHDVGAVKNNIKVNVNQFRRYRDLSIIMSAAFYALTIVDANVFAHLRTFDLSDDISIRFKPIMTYPGLATVGTVGMGLQISFK